MDPASQEALNVILAKNPETLNEDDIEFLRARQSYLKKAQLDEYDGILNPVEIEKAPLYVAQKDRKNQTSDTMEPVKENATTP
jgi:hypothetical protein